MKCLIDLYMIKARLDFFVMSSLACFKRTFFYQPQPPMPPLAAPVETVYDL